MTTPGERGTDALKKALAIDDADALDEAVDLLRTAGDAPWVLANLGAALRTRHRRAPHAGDLDEAIAALERAVAGTDPADPSAAGRLGTWGVALGDRYELQRADADLRASVAALERAVASARDATQAARQAGNLAGALLERHRTAHDPADLDRAIALASLAERTATEPADREAARGNLAAALHERFRRDGHRDDLDVAIGAALPDEGRVLSPRLLGVLGILLHSRFALTGDGDDLRNAIAVLGTAEQATRPAPGARPGGGRAALLGALGSALLDRFRWHGERADLDAAIGWHRAAVEHADAVDRAARLSNLGIALAARPEHDPRAGADLREALERHADAVALAGDTDPDRATILANQAGALLAAFETLGLDTLDAALGGYRRAAALTTANPAVHAGHLAQQAQTLRARAAATGDAAAAREAVRLLRAAIDFAGPDHRDHAVFRSSLGSALVARYVRHGSTDDLDEALVQHAQAVAGLTPGRVGAARWFAARAHALRLHAQATGLTADVTAAVEAYRVALTAEADARRLPDLLAALGSALDLRRATVADVTATVDVRREAVRRAAPDDPMRGPWLSDLANALRRRATMRDEDGAADAEEAHRLHADAVAATSPEHPEYATVLSNLAGSHRDRYVRTGSDADLDTALDLLRRAAAVAAAPARARFVAAETGARLAADTDRWAAARDAYTAAVDLLPAAAWRGADEAGREQPIRDTRWLAAEAAAAALQCDDPAQALALLERGRTVLWNQQTETGADLTALRHTAPALAERLDAARAVLDAEPGGSADARIAAAAAWDAAVVELRHRPDVAPFAPAGLPEVTGGTVAVVVISRYRRDVVLLDRDGPRVLPLTRLDLDALADHLGGYYAALDAVVDPADRAERRAADRRLTALLAWLGESVVDPVLDAVTAGPRLWWCPTGPFTALPLHAAGSAPDRAVSSYTPTIAALGRSRAVAGREVARVLGVAAPYVPGQVALPGTTSELDDLAAALPDGVAFTRLDAATRGDVATALHDDTWAHLACHAEQDLGRPARAAFLLTDGRLGLTTIARRPGRGAPGAYLSACHSALGGADLADEALNLAAAMQHAGYHQVIATLWPVTDRLARGAARRVYAALCAGGAFRPERSATAVHELMLALRREHPDRPSWWAPFVHLGP